MQTWRTIKGYLAGIVAFIACPCHLPFSLPLLIGLTGGTAFGAWLAHNSFLAVATSTTLFIGATALALKWLNQRHNVTVRPPLSSTGRPGAMRPQSAENECSIGRCIITA